jgi:hypothetical protein
MFFGTFFDHIPKEKMAWLKGVSSTPTFSQAIVWRQGI